MGGCSHYELLVTYKIGDSMKRSLMFLMCVAMLVVAFGCGGRRYVTYTQMVPVYVPLDEFRSAVAVQPAKELKVPGKIYVKGDYLFINEKDKGIHIYDNSNPRNPVNLAFINIPGNGDIAVKGTTLYADSYIDLVALDISDINNIRVLKRIQSIFPNALNQNGIYVDTTKGIAIDWKPQTVTVEVDENATSPYYYNDAYRGGVTADAMSGGNKSNTSSNSGGSSSGRGGSMARFTIYDRTLYAVSNSDMQMFALDNPQNPTVWAKINLGWNIETIFPYKDKLFIGSQTGMFIYENKDQRNPVQLCQFRHARSCDPVVAEGDYAYVTLRAGSICGGGQNRLDVVNIRDLTNPQLVKSYAMQEPYGVGVDGNNIFVCDGTAGLKLFDATDHTNLTLQSYITDFRTYDIIPMGTHAIVVGPDGLYQYDYTAANNLQLLSKISIGK